MDLSSKKAKRTLGGVLGLVIVLAVAIIYNYDSFNQGVFNNNSNLQGGVHRATSTVQFKQTSIEAARTPSSARMPELKVTTGDSRDTPSRPPVASETNTPSEIKGQVQFNPIQTTPESKNDDSGSGAICGDNQVTPPETCDDGNKITEACNYGDQNCVVCNASCKQVAGETSYCGDGQVDQSNAEECDGTGDCTSECELVEFNEIQMDLEDYYASLLNRIIPKETGRYNVPEEDDLDDFKLALELFLDGDYVQAIEGFEALDYEVVRLIDGNESHFVVQESEMDNYGDFYSGWGTFFIRENSEDISVENIHISVPHPTFDTNTPDFGLRVYQQVGETLSLAGSHRNANDGQTSPLPNQGSYNISDSVHADSILVAAGEVFADNAGDVFIDIHGHRTSSYSTLNQNNYHAVISSGSASQTTPLQEDLVDALELNNFEGAAGCGIQFNNILCGTKNVLKSTIKLHQPQADFLHIELGTLPRTDANKNSYATKVANSIEDLFED